MTEMNEDLSSFLQQFDAGGTDETTGRLTECVTIWLPKDKAAKYHRIQSLSRKKFSRVLRKLVADAIDKVKVDEAG